MNPARAFPESEERLITIQSALDELRNGIDGRRIDESSRWSSGALNFSRSCPRSSAPAAAPAPSTRATLAVIQRFGVIGKEGHSLGRLLIRPRIRATTAEPATPTRVKESFP